MPKLGTTIVALEHNQLLKCNKKNKWLQKKKIATNNLMKFYCPKVPIIYIYIIIIIIICKNWMAPCKPCKKV